MRIRTLTDWVAPYLTPALAIGALAVGSAQAGYVDEILSQGPTEFYALDDTSGTSVVKATIDSPTNDGLPNAVDFGVSSAPALTAAGGFAGFSNSNTWTDFDQSPGDALTSLTTSVSSDEGSISYWIKGDNTVGTQAHYIGIGTGGSSFGGEFIGTFHRDNGTTGIAIDGNQIEGAVGTLSLEAWHHVAATWKRNTGAADGEISYYVDGALVTSTTTASWTSFTTNVHQRFGKDTSTSGRLLDGNADSLAFFSTQLTTADIQNQVRAAHLQTNSQQLLRYTFEQPGTVIEGASDTILDVSGANNDGTVIAGGNTAATVDSERGDVLSKTGTGGIDVDLNSTSKTYTFVGWYKGTDSDGYFFDQETSRFVLGGGGIVAGSSLGVYDGTWHDTNLDGFRDGEWHHIAFTFNNTNGVDVFTAYVDGSASAQNNQVLANGIVDLSSDNRQKFASNFAGNAAGMNGLFDEIAVYDRAMTPGEINELIIKPQTDGHGRRKVLAVDIGANGQTLQFAGLDDEFSEFSATDGTGSTADGQTDTYDGVTVRIDSSTGTVGYRNRTGISHTAGDLLNDFVFAGGDILLTLSGLDAGWYELVLYSHDVGVHDDFGVLIDGIDTGVIVEASVGATPAVVGFGIVSFIADGTSDVVITLDQLNTTGDANIVFNGFELYVVPAPSALPAGLAMIGMIAARRRRK